MTRPLLKPPLRPPLKPFLYKAAHSLYRELRSLFIPRLYIGERVRAAHPLIRGFPGLFIPRPYIGAREGIFPSAAIGVAMLAGGRAHE
jgi:hypothetical protein